MPGFPDNRVTLTFGDCLSYGHLREVLFTLNSGGVCLLPSDTGYAIAAVPFRRDVMSRLYALLPGKRGQPIPLAFGSLSLVEQYVKLTAADYRTIDRFCPGPLTLVCQISERQPLSQVEHMLNTDGTIGVRIPDSPVERQISSELQRPITTCAVRDADGNIVQKFDEAIDMIRPRLEAAGPNTLLIAIHMRSLKYSEHSTVVTVQPRLAAPYSLYVYRQGVVEPDKIEDTLRRLSFWDLEDIT